MSQWKIVIAEDHAILRDGLKAVLATVPEFTCVGEAHDGKSAIRMVDELSPDIILINLSIPNTKGTETIREIKQRHGDIKIIVLTTHETKEYINTAVQAGIDGYILKDDNQHDLIKVLRSVLTGKSANSSMNNSASYNPDARPWEILTQREREVIKLIAEGKRNKEIATLLFISAKTVEKHRSNLMKKLDIHSIQAITKFAIRNALIAT